jgi:Ankyrin repeats (3 copies)
MLFQRLSGRAKQKYLDGCFQSSGDEWYEKDPTKICYPLHEAARNGHVHVVRLLVQDFHFNVNQYDQLRKTPLFYAVSDGSRNRNSNHADEMSSLLMELGAGENRAKEICRLLLEHGGAEAGVDASHALLGAIHEGNMFVCQLLLESGVDPFLSDESSSSSPFQVAARLQDTTILLLFLHNWNKQVGGNRKNVGMSPIHVLASDKHVSLPAIQLIITGGFGQAGQDDANHDNALMVVDKKHGLYPFHFAALSDVKLDVLYCILKHYPDALAHQQQRE